MEKKGGVFAPLTYADLKHHIDSLTPEQLRMHVFWYGERGGGEVYGLDIMSEDMINPSGDGMEPVSLYTDDPELLQTEKVVAKKGQPLLCVDGDE